MRRSERGGVAVDCTSQSLPVPLNLTRSRRQLSRKLQAPTPGYLLLEFSTAQGPCSIEVVPKRGQSVRKWSNWSKYAIKSIHRDRLTP